MLCVDDGRVVSGNMYPSPLRATRRESSLSHYAVNVRWAEYNHPAVLKWCHRKQREETGKWARLSLLKPGYQLRKHNVFSVFGGKKKRATYKHIKRSRRQLDEDQLSPFRWRDETKIKERWRRRANTPDQNIKLKRRLQLYSLLCMWALRQDKAFDH